MRLYTYVIILVSASIVFYMAGYQPLLFNIISDTTLGLSNGIGESFVNTISQVFSGLTGTGLAVGLFALLGIPLITGLVAGGNSFLPVFAVPLIMIAVVLVNFLIIPTEILLDNTVPETLRTIIILFFNVNLMLAILSFVRGD